MWFGGTGPSNKFWFRRLSVKQELVVGHLEKCLADYNLNTAWSAPVTLKTLEVRFVDQIYNDDGIWGR